MHIFHQDSGVIRDRHGRIIGAGYSGRGAHKNQHGSQAVKGEGPIPVGVYVIGEPRTSPHTGRFVLPLTPVHGNEMFGRGSFEMHGENLAHVGESSNGCIVAPLPVRQEIANSGDVLLAVLPPLEGVTS